LLTRYAQFAKAIPELKDANFEPPSVRARVAIPAPLSAMAVRIVMLYAVSRERPPIMRR
jgi:hypothetical protein